MKKLPISAIILAHQVTEGMQNCIAHLSFVSEIIIVDTSTTGLPENTLNDDRVVVKKFEPITNFSETRNWAIKQASFAWILMIDPDEICLIKETCTLDQLLNQTSITNFSIQRFDIFHEKTLHFGETSQSRPTRLFKKSDCTYVGKVHEVVTCNGASSQLDSEILKLHHYSHTSIASFFSKVCWYAQLEASQRNTSLVQLLLELITFPSLKWLYNLVWLQGFRDGTRGVSYATLMSFHSLLVRLFQIEKYYHAKTTR